jgi:hypothetical protein
MELRAERGGFEAGQVCATPTQCVNKIGTEGEICTDGEWHIERFKLFSDLDALTFTEVVGFRMHTSAMASPPIAAPPMTPASGMT